MKVFHESSRYNEYFDEVEGYYANQKTEKTMEPMGERIRKLREMQSFSLEDFSAASGVPVERLKRIEAQEELPDLGTVVKISRALKIGTGFLLDEASGYSYSIVRKVDRQNIERHGTGRSDRPNYEYQSLASGIRDRHMETFLVTLTGDEENEELSRHDGEEFIMVMEGKIKVVLGDKEELLGPGDTIYYLASIPHNVMNADTKDSVIMAVIYTGV